LPDTADQRDVRDGITDQARDVDLRSLFDDDTDDVSRIRYEFADLSGMDTTYAERVSVIRKTRKIEAGGVRRDVGNDLPFRIR
jgi:hypothetical protein